MGVLILPLLAATIFALIAYFGWLIFKPEAHTRPGPKKAELRQASAKRIRRRP